MTPESANNERSDAVADKTKVRVTQEPGVVREVDDAELVDLARLGIIHSFERTDHAKSVLEGIPTKGLKAWKPAERGDDIVTASADIAGGTDPKEA